MSDVVDYVIKNVVFSSGWSFSFDDSCTDGPYPSLSTTFKLWGFSQSSRQAK